uniref:GP34 n=1 Tax=Caviid herpesvirus 2 str. CIDMTR TaxID=1415526 RepID=U6HC11_9BETA|nr:GP34 [Caviid herpesvirus 2 str. CIDMTR]
MMENKDFPGDSSFQPEKQEDFDNVDALVRAVSQEYKSIRRAECRKRLLDHHLPDFITSKTATSTFIFCTKVDWQDAEHGLIQLKRTGYDPDSDGTSAIEQMMQQIRCRIRKNQSKLNDPAKQRMILTIRAFCVTFNRLAFLARTRHYHTADSRAQDFLRKEITERCSEDSRLTEHANSLIHMVDPKKYESLIRILTGMLCQTPHMWSRAIRLFSRMKMFYQICFLQIMQDMDIHIPGVFEPQFKSPLKRLIAYIQDLNPSDMMIKNTPLPESARKRRKRELEAMRAAMGEEPDTADHVEDEEDDDETVPASLAPPPVKVAKMKTKKAGKGPKDGASNATDKPKRQPSTVTSAKKTKKAQNKASASRAANDELVAASSFLEQDNKMACEMHCDFESVPLDLTTSTRHMAMESDDENEEVPSIRFATESDAESLIDAINENRLSPTSSDFDPYTYQLPSESPKNESSFHLHGSSSSQIGPRNPAKSARPSESPSDSSPRSFVPEDNVNGAREDRETTDPPSPSGSMIFG